MGSWWWKANPSLALGALITAPNMTALETSIAGCFQRLGGLAIGVFDLASRDPERK